MEQVEKELWLEKNCRLKRKTRKKFQQNPKKFISKLSSFNNTRSSDSASLSQSLRIFRTVVAVCEVKKYDRKRSGKVPPPPLQVPQIFTPSHKRNSPHQTMSSFSNNFDYYDYSSEPIEMMNSSHQSIDFPVYRSIALDQQAPQTAVSHSAPTSSKSFSSLNNSKPSQIILTDFNSSSSSSCDDNFDLMEFLNGEESTQEKGTGDLIARVEDLGFSCLSHTTVYFDNEVESSKVIDLVTQFLNENHICIERKGRESKWICESIIQLEAIKFQVQIFSTCNGFAVEFLRLRGCCLSFSSVFRKFGSKPAITTTTEACLAMPPTEYADESESINSLMTCVHENPVEAVKMICSVLSIIISQYSEFLTQVCHLLVESKQVYSILTLATHLSRQISVSDDPSQETLTLLGCYDQLIPSLVKYSFDSSQPSFVRDQSSHLLKERMAMY
jgi:hypothetical protein